MYSYLLPEVLERKPAEGVVIYVKIFTIGGQLIEVSSEYLICNQNYFEIKSKARNVFMVYSNIDYIEVVERKM